MSPARNLLDAVHLVKGKLAELPALDVENREPFDRAVDQLCRELVAVGGVIGERHDGHFVRFCTIRASATSGKFGALNNWVAAAYRRLDREALS